MPGAFDAATIGQAARRLLAAGSVGDELLRRSATVLHPVPVLEPGGGLRSWFVPLAVGEVLAAFFQFMPDGTLMRFSSFQRRPGELAGCPAAADWLDAGRIQARAETLLRPGESAGDPFLSFDRSPDRLVWAVPVARSGAETRFVYVAGESVYEPPPGGTFG
jgi:hypothetical protein